MTDNPGTDTLEEPTQTPPPPRPPLSRPVEGKVLGGVAAGIARHYGWDPLLVRIGFVLLCFVGGAGLLAYIAGWIMMPADTDEAAPTFQAPADLQERGIAFWIGIGLLVLAVLAMFGDTGLLGSGVPVAIALVAIGVALWRSGERRDAPAAVPPMVSDASEVESVDTLAIATAEAPPPTAPATVATPAGPVVPPAAPSPVPTPPRPVRPRSYLGRITFALSLIATAVAVILDRSEALALTPVQVLGVPLVVLAAGLLVGAWWGRARWLIIPALLLTLTLPVVAFADEVDLRLGDGIGESRVVFDRESDIADQRLSIGSMTLDLDDLVLEGPGPHRFEASVALGELIIRLPDDLDIGWEISATVRYGDLGFDGERETGRPATRTFTHEAAPGAPTLVLDATVGAGTIEITQ